MAEIKQVGVGRRTKGVVDGINYVTIYGRTIARRLPAMPQSMFHTPSALKRQALFTMIQWHLKRHRRTISQTFGRVKFGTPANLYFRVNYHALAQALNTLAEQMAAGNMVTPNQVETAVEAYATANPTSIVIGALPGFTTAYLTGSWPETITLNATSGDATIVVLVEENGDTHTYTPGITPDVNVNPGNNTNTGSGSGSNTGSGTGTGSGSGTGSDSGNGSNDGNEDGDELFT